METIELLLTMTPSLRYLFLLNNNNVDLFDGTRWEYLVEMKLPYLNTFQFAFQNVIDVNCEDMDLESILAPFQTSFWLQTKQWFVTAIGVKKNLLV
ncbi:hypothetical protein I4U23_020240 [Adineta vaga]|nr:hypothetical protein I4U23_020240 [Adineta vaga]